MFVLFFFFKQKTAYEMRISDWSSDVCSSDLSSCNAAKWLLQLHHVEREVQRDLDGFGRQALVVVDIDIGLELQTVADDLGASLSERLHEVRVWRFGNTDIGAERQDLVTSALHCCVICTVSPARSPHSVFLSVLLVCVGCYYSADHSADVVLEVCEAYNIAHRN